MNVAVLVTGGISETLQTTPLLRTLRAGLPQARLTLLCPASAGLVAAGIAPVDEAVALTSLEGRVDGPGAGHVWGALRRRRLDALLLCSTQAMLRVAAFFAGVPQRIGPGGGVTAALLSGHVTAEPSENLAATWLRLARLLGVRVQIHAPSFEPGPEARREADRVVYGTGLTDGRLLVALAPGTALTGQDGLSMEATAWAPERYALLANQLAVRHGAGIVFLGGPADRDVIERTMMDLGASAADLSGERDVRVLAGVIARCDLLVSGDTPLLHLAAAVGTPAVGLFGPTDGRVRGPYGSDHRIVQAVAPAVPLSSPAGSPGHAPMEQIRVEDVLASIEASI